MKQECDATNDPPPVAHLILAFGPRTVPCRWNPHRSPSLPRPNVGVLSADTRTSTKRTSAPDETREGGSDPKRSREQAEAGHEAQQVLVLGQASLPRSSGLSLDQVNYLMVDYLVGPPRPGSDKREGGGADAREGSRLGTGAELMVFVNDPGRSGSPVLSLKLDMWRLIELGG